MKALYGWLLYLCYKLENHCLMGISLKNWLWVLIVAPPVAAAFRRLVWVNAALLSLLGVLTLIGTEWAKRRRYLIFEPAPLGKGAQTHPPIQVDEQIAGWASGLFGVEGRTKYLVNERAHFSFVGTREHIVMAHVRETRFLLLTKSRKQEAGWWYVFFTPDRVQEVQTGYLSCGFKTRPALAILHQPEQRSDRAEEVYLAFADVDTVQRVLADLRLDVAPQALATG